MSWQPGPLPAGTWNWGGVVVKGTDEAGFYFADFRGDHVVIQHFGETGGSRRVEAADVEWFNNCLGMPPGDSRGMRRLG